MVNYKHLYSGLFNAITDSLTQLEARNYGEAEHILREAQKQAETLFLEGQDAP